MFAPRQGVVAPTCEFRMSTGPAAHIEPRCYPMRTNVKPSPTSRLLGATVCSPVSAGSGLVGEALYGASIGQIALSEMLSDLMSTDCSSPSPTVYRIRRFTVQLLTSYR